MASELLDEFIFDARDHLSTAGVQLLELEKEPDSLEALNSLLGTLHTIKGNSGFLNLKNLYGTLHAAENLLQTVREAPGHLVPPVVINQLFQVLDSVEAILTRLEADKDDEIEWLPALNQAIAEAQAALEAGGSLAEMAAEEEKEEEEKEEQEALDPVEEAIRAAANAPPEPSLAAQAAMALTGETPPQPLSGPLGSASPAEEEEIEAPPDAIGGGPFTQEWKILALRDGQLADEAEAAPKRLALLCRKGLKAYVLEMGLLTCLTAPEMRTLKALGRAADGRLGLVASRERSPDLVRVLQLWSLDDSIGLFDTADLALASLTRA
ncbi:MAG: Hpt domain-containing protein [Deltaproteobacteria bacterium]|jgi:chemotaxis protein histidine kinase CheA|nr:Hpt domain-containing protein [Deltaproteobacteria bacterium]